jgi:RimJ/RimL family protein N-acetyltransferase
VRTAVDVELRGIRPDDAERLTAFHAALSDETRYRRFFSPHPVLSRDEIRHFTSVDGQDRVALVAIDHDAIIAVSRYDRDPRQPGSAEVAFVVADARQGEGLGTLLLASLVDVARQHGITRFTADTQASNAHMMSVFRHSGFELSTEFDHAVLHVEFAISERRDP